MLQNSARTLVSSAATGWLCALVFSIAALAPARAQSQPEAKDMALVGYHDLQARSAYQPTIHFQGGRWIAYVGHHGGTKEVPKPRNELTGADEFNGTSIIEVTDPAHPKLLAHIPGESGLAEDGGAQMVRVCDGKSLPKGNPEAVYMLRTFGNSAHEIWNTADPAHPKLVKRLDGIKGTHKNWWECDTGIAFLVSGVAGWRVNRMTEVYDLGDPANPVKIRDFGLPGQQPGPSGPVPTRLHGAISTGPKGNRVYFGYGTNEGAVLQIVDREKLLKGPKEPTEANLLAPQVGRLDMSPLTGAHTTFPVLEMPIAEFAKDKLGKVRNFVVVTNEGAVLQIVDREKLLKGPKQPTEANLLAPQVGRLDMSPLTGAHTTFPVLEMPIAEFAKDKLGKVRNFVVVTNEQILNECLEPRQFVWFVDVTVEKFPASVSTWWVPEEPGGFCSRGGRFGTHASNESMTDVYYRRLMFFSHFNAGVRAVDIRDPYHPKEVAYYIPAVTKNTDKRCITVDGKERCKVAIQTNNVEVDDRGYIYAVDRANTGLHILELKGAAREIANWKK